MLNIIAVTIMVILVITLFIIIPLKLDRYMNSPKLLPAILTIMFMTLFIILLIGYISLIY